MNKILVKIYFPIIEEKIEAWIPLNKKIYEMMESLVKSVYGLKELKNPTYLYNRYTGIEYDINAKIKDTDIKNGTELILI